MAIVNFAIPKALEKRVATLIKEKGFASKAEFFRFSAIYFLDVVEKPMVSEDERFEYLTKALSKEISHQYRGKKLLSLSEQLKDI